MERPILAMIRLLAALAAASFLGGSTCVLAQEVIWQKSGGAPSAALAGRATSIGDLNADGVRDLLVSRLHRDDNGTIEQVVVVSGADGSDIQVLAEPAPAGEFGWALAELEDVDGDGVPDFAIGASALDFGGIEKAGAVFVHSGSDRSVLWSIGGEDEDIRFGAALALGADADGDGLRDLLVGVPQWLNVDGIGRDHETGKVFLVSAVDGTVLREWKGERKKDHFGIRCVDSGDLNADGIPDFLVAASYDRTSIEGKVYAYSGSDGALLFERAGAFPAQSFGFALAGVGDVDGDGFGDALVGAPEGTGIGTGRVFVLAGPDGAELAEIPGQSNGDFFGIAVAGPGDVSGDGVADLLIGSLAIVDGVSDAGRAALYSGANLRLLRTFREVEPHSANHYGKTLVALGDIDGDGGGDFGIASPNAEAVENNEGLLVAHAGDDLFLEASDSTVAAWDRLDLHTRGGAGGAFHLLAIVAVNDAPWFFVLDRGALDGHGESTFSATVPAGLSGLELDLLAFATAPGVPAVASAVETLFLE